MRRVRLRHIGVVRAIKQFQMADGNLIRRLFNHVSIRHLLLVRARLQPPRQRNLVAHIQFGGKTRAPSAQSGGGFRSKNYTTEELDALIDDIDDIDL